MKSLRRQLTRELLVWLALLQGGALAGLYVAVWFQLNHAFDVALEARALGVGALAEQRDGHVEVDTQERVMRGFGTERSRNYFELRGSSGELIARSPSLKDSRLNQPQGAAIDKPAYWNLTLPNGRPGRAVRFLFRPKPASERQTAPLVTAELVVAVDREDHDEVLGGLLAAVVGIGVLLLAAVFLVVPRVLRRGLAPVDRLGEQAARIDAGSLAERFAVADLPAELQPIAGRLNDLLARLEASFERERRFSADLAHELRTPLAELRSLAECALKWPAAREASTDRETLAIALRMEALVTRLLALARGERGQLAAQLEPVELGAFVAQAWQLFAERANTRSLSLSLTIAGGSVPADPVLLRSILANLFDNAVDYASSGSVIAVSGGTNGLRIANPAGGLSAEDVARFFDRFWRKEAARSDGQHAGLGLSLARAFATAMGWRLTASLEGEQLVFLLGPGDR